MTIPPPLDPVLLREHAYQDTKILRLVLPKEDQNSGFVPVYLKGLGSFDYNLVKTFPSAFTFRSIDVNNRDPNYDQLANADKTPANTGPSVVGMFAWFIGVVLVVVLARKMWSMKSFTKQKNHKNLLVNSFNAAPDLESRMLVTSTPLGFHLRALSLELIETPRTADDFKFLRVDEEPVKTRGLAIDVEMGRPYQIYSL